MGKRNGKRDVDAQADYHGCTAEQMRHALDRALPSWQGLSRVRVIHGQGTALTPTLLEWCRERGIPCQTEPTNPGSSLLYPSQRVQKQENFGTALRERMPEELQQLRFAPPDPEAQRKAQEEQRRAQEEQRRRELARKELERREKDKEAEAERKRRQDALLWEAEKARLDAMNRQGGKQWENDVKPKAPAIVTRSVHTPQQEGYWKGELVRVADTDTETLKKEKRTGLDKLAPPIEDKPAEKPEKQKKPAAPTRDETADRALFEAEMARLMEGG
jgi:hypothetical protein